MDQTPKRTETRFELVGEALCLDFANTVNGFRGVNPRDQLRDYAALLSWSVQAGAVGEAQARRLSAEARRRPADAEAALGQAVALREAAHDVFLAFARGGEPPLAALKVLNEHLGRALSHRRIRRGGACCTLGWEEDGTALDAPLWPVAASAAELLVSGEDLERVRVCGLSETEECGWLFVDRTRSHTRRWCSMKDCGNVAKARRHYRRARGGG